MAIEKEIPNHIKAIVYFCSVLLFGVLTWKFINNDYMTYRRVEVETIQLYGGMSSGKYNSLEFIGVYKTKDGVFFSRNIDASVMATTKVGDIVAFKLRPMDIQQTQKQNILYFILPAIAASAYVSFALFFGFTLSFSFYETIKRD